MKIDLKSAICLTILSLTFTACEKKAALRQYDEIAIPSPTEKTMSDFPIVPRTGTMDAPNAEMLKSSIGQTNITWKTPDGWSEQKGDAMRLVTFTGKDVTCTIVSLGGPAGGVEANIVRWMKQINLDPNQLSNTFLKSQEQSKTESGLVVQMIDLTQLSQADQPSILAAIIEVPGTTIFIKMTGPIPAIKENEKLFRELVKSISVHE
jgi:hypothetical protein